MSDRFFEDFVWMVFGSVCLVVRGGHESTPAQLSSYELLKLQQGLLPLRRICSLLCWERVRLGSESSLQALHCGVTALGGKSIGVAAKS